MKNVMPVYLFLGFLEGGKTSIIQESLADPRFNTGEKFLVIQCEEGETELDPTAFAVNNVRLETIEDEEDFTSANLMKMVSSHKTDRVIIEYNGMWPLERLYAEMPENWQIYQQMTFAEAKTFLTYNANMRQQTYDKLVGSEMLVLNRATDDLPREEIHKVVRAISRRIAIVYDFPDGRVEYDEIEDPLPFDKEADVISVGADDYALFYRDLSENLPDYEGKTVRFLGMVAVEKDMPANGGLVGRHVMTCCAADVQYMGLAMVFSKPAALKTGDWIVAEGKIKVEKSPLYRSKGPVLYVTSTERAQKPANEVATFY